MQLTVPFIIDEEYIIFLKNNTEKIGSIYFSLPSNPVLDASLYKKDLSGQFIEPDGCHSLAFVITITWTTKGLIQAF